VGNKIAAVVTAYHPDERLAAVVESALLSCESVVIADNTPGDAPSLAEKSADSRVRVLPPELVSGLLRHLADDPTIGVVGPTPVDAETGGRYERAADRHAAVDDRPSIITSGMLVRRAALEKVPGFREDFFVDCVDTDFCLRIRRSGSRVVRDAALVLPHSIGSGRDHRLGPLNVRVLHYPAWRHYWIARNGLVLSREFFASERGFVITNALFMARWLVVTTLFDDRRRASVPAVLRGLLDGLTGRVRGRYLPAGAEYGSADA